LDSREIDLVAACGRIIDARKRTQVGPAARSGIKLVEGSLESDQKRSLLRRTELLSQGRVNESELRFDLDERGKLCDSVVTPELCDFVKLFLDMKLAGP
jgi:hypothetical protein